jgi:RNA polymerase sigma-70 factor (ECF subfamily)
VDLTRSEAELLTGIAAGDVNAFETLHARYERKVRSLCPRLLRDHTEAEEVAQEAFLQVWRRAGSLTFLEVGQ